MKAQHNYAWIIQNVPQSWWFWEMFLSIQETVYTSFWKLWNQQNYATLTCIHIWTLFLSIDYTLQIKKVGKTNYNWKP